MTGRVCPVPGCGATARAGHAMCRNCWSMVPRESQRLVYGTWRAVRADRTMAAVVNYREALAQAVNNVLARPGDYDQRGAT